MFVFCLLSNPPSIISTACINLDMGLSSGTWSFYQEIQRNKELTLLLLGPSTANSFSPVLMCPSPFIHARLLTGLIKCESYADLCRSCEFINITILSCSEDPLSPQTSSRKALNNFSVLSLMIFLLWGMQ